MYRLCQRYNLLLVEDDAYFFLQYPSGPGTAATIINCPSHSSLLAAEVQPWLQMLHSLTRAHHLLLCPAQMLSQGFTACRAAAATCPLTWTAA